MAEPHLAILIPHYNDPARLETCLKALAPQIRAAGAQVETVIIDNNSPLDMGPRVAAYPWARLLIEPVQGAAAARNRGVADSSAPALIFLDSDCVPAADWLETALALSRAPDGSVPDRLLGGRVDTFDETPPPRSGAEAFETVFAFHQQSYIEQKGFSVTANLLTSRTVFAAAGPMVPGQAEDVDWCHAATAQGFELSYAPQLRVSHPTRQDWAALTKKWRRTTREMCHSNGTGPRARLSWALRALIVGASALPHSPALLTSAQLSGREKFRGLVTLWRLRLLRMWWMLNQALLRNDP